MLQKSTSQPEFSLRESRSLIGDLFEPRGLIYWTDFLVTFGLGTFCFQQVRGGTMLGPHQGFQGTFSQAFFFFASVLLYYRAAMFIHEVVHLKTSGRLKGFRFVWNLLCGIPFLVPSFIYYTHIDHHRRKHYGTDRDGEYLPLGNQHNWRTSSRKTTVANAPRPSVKTSSTCCGPTSACRSRTFNRRLRLPGFTRPLSNALCQDSHPLLDPA